MVDWILRSLVPFILVVSVALSVAALVGVAGLGAHVPAADAASSQYLMCNWTVAPRTQTVYIDPAIAQTGVSKAQVLAAFQSWNNLFVKFHGFPIFAETGEWWMADVVINGHSSPNTWVDTVCNPGYQSTGHSTSTVFLGRNDSSRNASMIVHELGHTLGLSDHGTTAQHLGGHIGYQPCGNYYGVMSYCTSSQSWFLDIQTPGIYVDGNLVRDYWN